MNFLRYMLESSGCLILSYCTFRIIFRNDTRFSYQRLFLIATLLLSLLLPAVRFRIDLPWAHETKAVLAVPYQNAGFAVTDYVSIEETRQVLSYTDLLLYIYVCVMSVLLLTTAFQVIRIAFVIRSSKQEQYKNLVICRGEKITNAYSFLWWIFIPDSITDSEERKSIITHESVHSDQLHTLDNLILGIITAIMWFNPVIWLFRRSLHLVHEYLADEGTLDSGIEKLKYQMFLINQVSEDKLVFVQSSFNNKLLKKRMIMMTEMTNRRNGKFRILNLISVSTIMFFTVAFLNSFFPKDMKASGQTASASATSTQDVKKDKKKDDLKEVTVTGYQKSAASATQDVKKDKAKSDSKDVKEITVVGYGTQKVDATGSSIVISEGDKSNLESVTVVGYAKNGEPIPDSVNYIVDGVSVKSISDINPDSIGSINVLKQDRLIIVRTKGYEKKISKITKPAGTIIISDKSSLPGNIIYILDDKKVSKEDVQNINPKDIQSISVLKDKETIKVYGGEEHDGVIIITTKK